MAIRKWNAAAGTWDAFGSPQINVTSLGINTTSIGAISVVNGQVTTANSGLNVVRNITTSTSAPSGGNDGDVWFQYS